LSYKSTYSAYQETALHIFLHIHAQYVNQYVKKCRGPHYTYWAYFNMQSMRICKKYAAIWKWYKKWKKIFDKKNGRKYSTICQTICPTCKSICEKICNMQTNMSYTKINLKNNTQGLHIEHIRYTVICTTCLNMSQYTNCILSVFQMFLSYIAYCSALFCHMLHILYILHIPHFFICIWQHQRQIHRHTILILQGAAGNVSIGLNTTQAKLHVGGTAMINNATTLLSSLNVVGNIIGSVTALTSLNYSSILNPPTLVSFNNPSTFISTLNVSGNTLLNNATTLLSSLNVSGNTTINNNTTIKGIANIHNGSAELRRLQYLSINATRKSYYRWD
jgi:hypothetical protein